MTPHIDIPAYIDDIAAATAQLLASAQDLDDAGVAAPSLLPDWNRAMVLTHVARNADGAAGVLSGAREGVVVAQYPHGFEGRAADIEAGRHRLAADLLADVQASSARLGEAYAAMRAHDWTFESEWFGGTFPVWQLVGSRRREVEVHHVDLALAYGPDDWPRAFVDAELAEAVAALGKRLGPDVAVRLLDTGGEGEWQAGPAGPEPAVIRAPRGQLLAWLFGRPSSVVDAPDIGPWP